MHIFVREAAVYLLSVSVLCLFSCVALYEAGRTPPYRGKVQTECLIVK